MSTPVIGAKYHLDTSASPTLWRRNGSPSFPADDATAPQAMRAGAVPLGTAGYVIPSGHVVYVAPGGSDAAAGTLAAPKATLQAALSAVTTGGTVVLRGGEYRQNVTGNITKICTIMAYPGEVVWFDGTDVETAWTAEGGRWWAPLTVKFDHSASYTQGSDAGGFVGPQNPMAAWPDMVFIDGARQWHVASNPAAGQFSVDYTANRVWIGSNPAAKEVRVTKRGRWVILAAAIRVLGIGVRRFATNLPELGACLIVNAGGGSLVENCVFADIATQAVSAGGNGTTVRSTTIVRPGHCGIHSNNTRDLTVDQNYIEQPNWERFNEAPSSGGMKFTRAWAGLKIRHNIVKDAIGCTPIWLDVTVYDFVILNNLVDGGTGTKYCIFAELSEKGIVAGNRVIGAETKYALTAFDAGNVRFWNNYIDKSDTWAIGASQDSRRSAADPTLSMGGTVPWVTVNTQYCNNVVTAGNTLFKMYALDKETRTPGDTMIGLVAGNLLGATSTAPLEASRMFGWGGNDNVTVTIYRTPSALETAKPSKARNNTLVPNGTPTAADMLAAAARAEPMPADIAALFGLPTGARVVGPPLPAPVPAA